MQVRSELARDALVALAWAAGTVAVLVPVLGPFASALGTPLSATEQALLVGLAALQALALVLRRRTPVGCLLLVIALQLALVAVLPPGFELRAIAPLVAVYTLGTRLGGGRLVGWIAGAVLLESVGSVLVNRSLNAVVRTRLLDLPTTTRPVSGPVVLDWLLSGLVLGLFYGAAALLGHYVATRQERVRLADERAAAAVAEQQARAAVAVGAERARMARELHDVAAHHLTGLVLQASAAERLVDRDPEAAKQAAREIRAQGREALANLRAVVGVLREPGPGPAVAAEGGAPVPGLEMLDTLLESARTLGNDVSLVREGRAYALPPVADTTAYRLLQEALSNARQHAPGRPVEVRLDYAEEGVRLRVSNPLPADAPAPATGGFGLLGMRERTGLAGGRVSAGPTGDGRWLVEATLPREPAVA